MPENNFWPNNYSYDDLNNQYVDQSSDQFYYNKSYYNGDGTEYDPTFNITHRHTFTPNSTEHMYARNDTGAVGYNYDDAHMQTEYDEPPLLEELEIYPERIIEKSLAVLNPFHAQELSKNPAYLFVETDLAGPIMFCLTLAASLFLSGSKAHFGYIYGLSVISVIVMYILITLMCNTMEHYISITAVASILGYSILPIVWLSILGIFLSLNSAFGIALCVLAVALATMGASNIFCLMTGDPKQRLLLAYPCSLVYVIFVLLVLF